MKLKDGSRASLYIPDLNWSKSKLELTDNSLYMLTGAVVKDHTERVDQPNLRDKLLTLLEVSASDFSPQMQLLGGMTWDQLQAQVNEIKAPRYEAQGRQVAFAFGVVQRQHRYRHGCIQYSEIIHGRN